MFRFTILAVMLAQLVFVSVVNAGDFGWLDNMNVKAEADKSGFRYRLSTRFKVGDADIKTVLSNVDRPSDAYMIFRLGEMSHRPYREVIKAYKSNRGKGWGVIAKNMGIKPGSSEFHALKRGHDLDSRGKDHKGHDDDDSSGNSKDSGKGKGNSKGNGKDKGKGNNPGKNKN